MMLPTGSTPAEVEAFYEQLLSNYITQIPTDRTEILWAGPIAIAFFAAVLIGFFFFYSYYFNRSHRSKGELYGAASFAGSILERIGPISIFSWVVWIAVALWALYYIMSLTLNGFTY
jgi:hypothetical protein